MLESDRVKGIGTYFSRMFEVMRLVSKEVGYDAWHQFGVVNQLRFLGLLKKDSFQMDSGVVKGYMEQLRLARLWFRTEREFLALVNSSISSSIQNTGQKSKVESITEIMDSSKIKDNDRLLIVK